MIRKSLIALAAATLILSASCNKESIKSMYASQETMIETILNNLLSADEEGTMYVVGNGGSQRLVVVEGEGEPLTASGTVSFMYEAYTIPSTSISASNLFATNVFETAKSAGRDTTDLSVFEPVTEKLSDKNLVKGLHNGIIGVKAGEECFILFSGKYGFGGSGMGTVPSHAALAYHLKITDVSQ